MILKLTAISFRLFGPDFESKVLINTNQIVSIEPYENYTKIYLNYGTSASYTIKESIEHIEELTRGR